MRRLWLAAAFCVAAIGPGFALDKETVQREANAFAEAFNKGDAAAIAEFYTENAYLMPPRADFVRGRDDIAAFWKRMSEQSGDMRVTTLDVADLGEEAVREIGTFTLQPSAQAQESVVGKYVVVLRKVGDDWKIATQIWNENK